MLEEIERSGSRVRIVIDGSGRTADHRDNERVRWLVVDGAVAVGVLLVIGWLILPIVGLLRWSGHYHRIEVAHPDRGRGRLGWLGPIPDDGEVLSFPRILIPILSIDLFLGTLSLQPGHHNGFVYRAQRAKTDDRRVVIDLRGVSSSSTDVPSRAEGDGHARSDAERTTSLFRERGVISPP